MFKTLYVLLSLCVIFTRVRSAHSQTPSVRIPEYEAFAGQSFSVTAFITDAPDVALRVDVLYALGGNPSSQDNFSCYGFVQPKVTSFMLECAPRATNRAGSYSNLQLTLSNSATGESTVQNDASMPRVLLREAATKTRFPKITGFALSLTEAQALRDASRLGEQVLQNVQSSLARNSEESAQNRNFLLGQVGVAKGVVETTRQRYLKGLHVGDPKLPIFLEDFDRRFDRVARELSKAKVHAALTDNNEPRVLTVSFQRPQTKDSVEARPGHESSLSKATADFTQVLVEWVKGTLGMSENGQRTFKLSTKTTPDGAKLYISREQEKERQLPGVTDMHDLDLEYASWTFRFEWNGCSTSESPYVYLSKEVLLTPKRDGCKK